MAGVAGVERPVDGRWLLVVSSATAGVRRSWSLVGALAPDATAGRPVTESQRRRVPLISGDELATQLEFLDFQRAAVLIKCEGLSAAQLRARLVPTGTNLLGLVAHLTVAECYWFGHVLGGEPYPDPDFSMEVDAEQDCGEVLGAYRDSWSASNAVVHRIADPNALTALPVAEEHLPLRWLVGHMATETARHAGHADILRELLDGVTGR